MFKLSFSKIIQLSLIGIILYQVLFTWVPLWRTATQLEGVDVSNILIESEQGTIIPISSFKGEPLIINFWATWCLPCRVEIPMLRSIYSTLREKKKQLIGVGLSDSWETVIRFRKQTPMPYPLFRDLGPLSKKLNIRMIPAIAVIDKDGKVESITYGFRPWVQAYLLWWI